MRLNHRTSVYYSAKVSFQNVFSRLRIVLGGTDRFPSASVCFLVLLMACLSPAVTAQASAVTPQILHSIRQVRTLSLDRARAATPVRLSGQVVLFPGWRNSFFFFDGSYGIVVDRDTAYPALLSGDTIQVQGITIGGKFAPSVVARRVVLTGHRPLPPAKPITMDGLRGGQQDSQWISIRGLVRSAQPRAYLGKDQLALSVDMGGGALISVLLLHYPANAAALLDGASVHINGVCGSLFNTRRQFIDARLYVNSFSDVHIDRRSTNEPFASPTSSLDDLLRFNGKISPRTRVHVQGTITYIKPDVGFYLQQGNQAVFVESDQRAPIHVGDAVQVVGFANPATYSPSIVNASFRSAQAQPPTPVPLVSATSLLTLTDGYVFVPYDSLLIRLQGTLVEIIPSVDEHLLILNVQGTLITAKLALSTYPRSSFPQIGSTIALTGVCTAVTNGMHEAHGTSLLLRSASDIQIVRPAAWWTGTRSWYIVEALMAVLLALLAWIAFIRRQARLHELIVRDPLTGLYNRRGFLLMAERQWEHAIRNNQQMLLFYIDLDHFKQINDTLGHKEGDIALQTTATVFRDCFRKTDVIGRLGGDEFAVTALDSPDTPEASIRKRILQALTTANNNQHQPYSLALSVGVLHCDEQLASVPIEDLLTRADSLMYQQKRASRPRSPASKGSSALHSVVAHRSGQHLASLSRSD